MTSYTPKWLLSWPEPEEQTKRFAYYREFALPLYNRMYAALAKNHFDRGDDPQVLAAKKAVNYVRFLCIQLGDPEGWAPHWETNAKWAEKGYPYVSTAPPWEPLFDPYGKGLGEVGAWDKDMHEGKGGWRLASKDCQPFECFAPTTSFEDAHRQMLERIEAANPYLEALENASHQGPL